MSESGVHGYADIKVQLVAKNFFRPRLNFSNPPPTVTPLTAIKHLNVHWTAPRPPLQYPGTGLRFLRNLPYANVTYVQFWHTVAKEMPGLRKLQFVIDDCRWLGKVSIDDAWLGPLKEVRGLGRFDLGTEGGRARMQVTGIEHELRIIMCASTEK